MPGDLDLDCDIDVADVVVLSRALEGSITLLPEQEEAAHVAPLITVDNVLDVGDLTVLLRAVAGLVTLPPGVACPTLTNPEPGTLLTNPFSLEGTASFGQTVTIYVNGIAQDEKFVDDVIGKFEFDEVPLDDVSYVYVVATDSSGATSSRSNLLQFYSPPVQPKDLPSGKTIVDMETLVFTRHVDEQEQTGFSKLPYVIGGDLIIGPGGKLVVKPGVTLQFAVGAQLIVQSGGVLQIQGSSDLDVILRTSDPEFNPQTNPNPEPPWGGVSVENGGTATIDWALLLSANQFVTANGANVSLTIRNSELRDFRGGGRRRGINVINATATIEDNLIICSSGDGIRVEKEGAATTISGNLIIWCSSGIELADGSPLIYGNTIQHCTDAFHLTRASLPTILNNFIDDNDRGVRMDRGGTYQNPTPPSPILRNNTFTNNIDFNGKPTNLFYDNALPSEAIVVDARENYWGTNDPAVALATIRQAPFPNQMSYLTLPFLDDEGVPIPVDGTIVSGTYSIPTTWSDPKYVVDGTIIVDGAPLVVNAGVSVDLGYGQGERAIHIKNGGILSAVGTASQRIKFTALGTEWEGIHVGAGSSILFDNVDIENIQNVQINEVNLPKEFGALTISDTVAGNIVQITNSTVTNFVRAGGGVGIKLTNVESATIDNVHIENPRNIGVAIGIEVIDSAPTISNSTLHQLATGILIPEDSSNFSIGPGNTFTDFRTSGITVLDNGNVGEIADNTFDNDLRIAGNPPKNTGIGIDLVNSSPQVLGNTITNAEAGIKVALDSQPAIAANTIMDNAWGIWLEGGGSASALGPDPEPAITGNTIQDNDRAPDGIDDCHALGANLCISSFAFDPQDPTQEPIRDPINATGNFWGSTSEQTIVDSIQSQANNPVVVNLTSYLDNAHDGTPPGVPFSPNETYSFLLRSVGTDVSAISPTYGEEAVISFDLLADATVTIELYIESDGTYNANSPPGVLVRTEDLGLRLAAANPHLWTWNGKDDNGLFVADEAYKYVITATPTLGTGSASVFNPQRPGPAISTDIGHVSTPTYNAFRNENYIMSIDSRPLTGKVRAGGSRVRWAVKEFSGGPFIRALKEVVLPIRDDNLFVYDGRLDSGVVFDGPSLDNFFFWEIPVSVSRNSIIVENTKPTPRNVNYDLASTPPRIEVKSNPYLIHPTYDQISTIEYQLDQDATVTMKILKPGFGDPAQGDEVVATLFDGVSPESQQTAGTIYAPEWKARDLFDSNSIAKEDGIYTFWIRAENPTQSNLYSIYRGVIQVQQ